MINLLKKIELHKKPRTEKNYEIERTRIMEELKEISIEMEKTNLWFQMENNSDLIDACIHQREVLNARYRYLINKIKLDKIS